MTLDVSDARSVDGGAECSGHVRGSDSQLWGNSCLHCKTLQGWDQGVVDFLLHAPIQRVSGIVRSGPILSGLYSLRRCATSSRVVSCVAECFFHIMLCFVSIRCPW